MSDFFIKSILVILAAAVHELGHITASAVVGVKRFRFSFKPNGTLLTFDFSRVSYIGEALVHLSGGLFGIISACAAQVFFPASVCTNYFTGLSLSFTVINMLPLRGLDGYGFIRAVLSIFLMPDRIYNVMKIISWATAILLLTAVIYVELKLKPNLGLAVFASSMLIISSGENYG